MCQERMWRASKDYREAGYPVTDAREQAERHHLMLEPEDKPTHEEPTSPLAEVQAAIAGARVILRRLGTSMRQMLSVIAGREVRCCVTGGIGLHSIAFRSVPHGLCPRLCPCKEAKSGNLKCQKASDWIARFCIGK